MLSRRDLQIARPPRRSCRRRRAPSRNSGSRKLNCCVRAVGNVTLLHVTDVHGQLVPVYFREPSINLGVGEARGLPPHLAGKDFLDALRHPGRQSAAAYALTAEDFAALAQSYGRIGGLDRLATVVKAMRAERGEIGCCCSTAATPGRARSARYRTRGQDMVDCFALLKPDAMTGHWEFTSAPRG